MDGSPNGRSVAVVPRDRTPVGVTFDVRAEATRYLTNDTGQPLSERRLGSTPGEPIGLVHDLHRAGTDREGVAGTRRPLLARSDHAQGPWSHPVIPRRARSARDVVFGRSEKISAEDEDEAGPALLPCVRDQFVRYRRIIGLRQVEASPSRCGRTSLQLECGCPHAWRFHRRPERPVAWLAP